MDKTQVGFWRYVGEVLRLSVTEDVISWQPLRRIRLHAERQQRATIFSSVGLSAESWQFIIRAQDIRVTDAIRSGDDEFFLTAIRQTPERPGFFTVDAAKVQRVTCCAAMESDSPGPIFPAVLTEKYLRHEQYMPEAVNLLTFVLVTPKCVTLQPGSLVDVGGEPYQVLVAHELDAVKNEYEVYRKVDL